jgi:putative transposase
VNLLRKIEIEIVNGKKVAQAAREVGICKQTYFRWRKEFGGLKLNQARRPTDLVAQMDDSQPWHRRNE